MEPFYIENEEGILRAIIEKNLDLQSDPWPFISGAAKDLVKKMLLKDPKERITVNEILSEFHRSHVETNAFICMWIICVNAFNLILLMT